MSRQEWDSLPWWESEMLLEGLTREFSQSGQTGAAPNGTSGNRSTDLTSADADLSGFSVRRAG